MVLASPSEEIKVFKMTTLFGITITERLLYAFIGFCSAIVIMLFEFATDAVSSHKILMAAFGMMAGLIFASFFYTTIPVSIAAPENSRMACNLMFGYFGIILALKHADRFHLSRLKFILSQAHERPKVLDSSVIIDGRVRELIELRVIQGQILIPNFVLRELQAIADSNDPNRKSRGRRGLNMLEGLRELSQAVELVDREYPQIASVDQQLIQLCRDMDTELITNDYNLQKVAQFHRITVLNLNEISNALKPNVYVGEIFDLAIVRNGKEPGQGVGYLEDGTMVVVDDAQQYMGQEISVNVISMLQTSSGRMIFARIREDHATRRITVREAEVVNAEN